MQHTLQWASEMSVSPRNKNNPPKWAWFIRLSLYGEATAIAAAKQGLPTLHTTCEPVGGWEVSNILEDELRQLLAIHYFRESGLWTYTHVYSLHLYVGCVSDDGATAALTPMPVEWLNACIANEGVQNTGMEIGPAGNECILALEWAIKRLKHSLSKNP